MMDLTIYTSNLTPTLVRQIENQFLSYQMQVTIHPDFTFDEETDNGFLPFKLRVEPGKSALYDKFGSSILTGFEIYISDYEYDSAIYDVSQEQEITPKKKSFFSSLFGSGDTPLPKPVYLKKETNEEALSQFPQEVEEYEQSYSEDTFYLEKFEDWA